MKTKGHYTKCSPTGLPRLNIPVPVYGNLPVYETYPCFLTRDSLSEFALKIRDKYGTHLDKFGEKLWDRSRGHLAASLINHY